MVCLATLGIGMTIAWAHKQRGAVVAAAGR
jgi:hypothetical protein